MAQLGTRRWRGRIAAALFGGLGAAVLLGCTNEVQRSPRGCYEGGKEIAIGTHFTSGCNDCVCGDDRSITCTPTDDCIACSHEGEGYRVGESFPAGDGCNICQCQASGEAVCTAANCGGGCIHGGTQHPVGASFPAGDGCNTCSCEPGGTVACTEMACGCDPDAEWWRHYEATDPETCAVIDFACPDHTVAFENECGCGCAQSRRCEESYDCSNDACDPLVIAVECPYSQIIR